MIHQNPPYQSTSQTLEQLLETITRTSWVPSGQPTTPRSFVEQQIQQFIADPAAAVPVLVAALEDGGKFTQATVFDIARHLPYPDSRPIIPYLLYFVGDPNFPGWPDVAHNIIISVQIL